MLPVCRLQKSVIPWKAKPHSLSGNQEGVLLTRYFLLMRRNKHVKKPVGRSGNVRLPLKMLSVLGLILLAAISAPAQETISASGGNGSGSGGFVSFSVGQLFYSVSTGDNGSAIGGVQQPYEISIITAVPEAGGISLEASVFPNPASGFIILSIADYNREPLEYFLHDINGRMLEQGRITATETTINMAGMVSGVYFLRVVQSVPASGEVKTFKIIKNQ